MKESLALELMAKYFTKEINPEEEARLMNWVDDSKVNQAFFSDALQIWQESEHVEPDVMVVDPDVAWDRFEQSITPAETDKEPPIVSLSPRMNWWRVAAAILFILGIGLTWQQLNNEQESLWVEIETDGKAFLQVVLPDNSKVLLEENTSLRYKKSFVKREVELEGAARFSVVSDVNAPFSIRTDEVTTTVLGTQFSIRAYPEEKDVAVQVTEGLVSVAAPSGTEKQLVKVAKGEGVLYEKESKALVPGESPGPNEDAWLTQRLVFEDTPLREVIMNMKALYQVDLNLANPGIHNCPVSIVFDQVDFDQALEDLSFILGLDIEQTSTGGFRINGTSCTE